MSKRGPLGGLSMTQRKVMCAHSAQGWRYAIRVAARSVQGGRAAFLSGSGRKAVTCVP